MTDDGDDGLWKLSAEIIAAVVSAHLILVKLLAAEGAISAAGYVGLIRKGLGAATESPGARSVFELLIRELDKGEGPPSDTQPDTQAIKRHLRLVKSDRDDPPE